jgi:hypothetical protein
MGLLNSRKKGAEERRAENIRLVGPEIAAVRTA